jgi:ribonuclease HI
VTITAAADGSALGNPGPAGWAWYIDADRWAAGGWPHGTNNMGELKAVLELFRATAGVDDDLLVLCDSQYVINSVVKWMPGWKRKGWRKADGAPVMNVELMQDIDAALQGRRYRFEWVKGHVGHELNEAADERARGAATAYQRGTEVPGGPGFTPSTTSVASRPAPAVPPVSRRLTLDLSEDEWVALERRARAAAVSPEALLRSLAAGGR